VDLRTGVADEISDDPQLAEGTVTRISSRLLPLAGFSWLLALMLWVVLTQVTDYVSYDLSTAAALTSWIDLLMLTGVAAAVGSIVIVALRYEARTMTRRASRVSAGFGRRPAWQLGIAR